MPTEVVLPRLGLTQDDGTVVRWLKPEGSRVAKGEPLFEVMTDKATLEIEAPASGVLLRILVAEGGTVPVSTPIAVIGEPGETVPARGPIPSAPAPRAPAAGIGDGETGGAGRTAHDATPTVGDASGRMKISPRARALAEMHGLDVRALVGSGPGGRIIERDVQTAVESRAGAPSAVPGSASAPPPRRPPPPHPPRRRGCAPSSPGG